MTITESMCEFNILAMYEETPVEGNALVSGDPRLDKDCEGSILNRLDNGDIWAWACVKVTCSLKGFEGIDYLGCCSYKDEDDFKQCGYYEDMKSEAFRALCLNIQETRERLDSME